MNIPNELEPLTPEQILMQINTGKPFKFRDPDKHFRVITISVSGHIKTAFRYIMSDNLSLKKDHINSNMVKTLIKTFCPIPK